MFWPARDKCNVFHHEGQFTNSNCQNHFDDEIFKIMHDEINLYATKQINKKKQESLFDRSLYLQSGKLPHYCN
jgi:hypothetical protein